jgi:hypothetical protein
MSISNSGYDANTQAGNSDPGSAEDGPGETMDVWTSSRSNQLTNLATGTYTNESSFTIPAGVVDSTPYDTGWQNGEKGTHRLRDREIESLETILEIADLLAAEFGVEPPEEPSIDVEEVASQ